MLIPRSVLDAVPLPLNASNLQTRIHGQSRVARLANRMRHLGFLYLWHQKVLERMRGYAGARQESLLRAP